MSLQMHPISPIPEMTVQVAQAAFRKGNVYMQMRDILGTFFTNDQFRDLYPYDGQPAYDPWRLALVSIMQFAENLSDRQAADAVRARIDWKYALSLELTDDGFDFSVLSEFRQRLIDNEAGQRLLDTMLAQFVEAGLLGNGGKQRTDSTHVIANVQELNRLMLVGRTFQTALDAVTLVAADWLQEWVAPDWFTRYGKLLTDFRLPQKRAERDALTITIGQDGLLLLNNIWHHPQTPPFLREVPSIQILRQVWIQQYVIENDQLRKRDRKEMPPAAQLIQSPFDIDARFSRKQSRKWLGYKVHFTETCNDDAPHLITNVQLVKATQQDYDAVEPIHQSLKQKGCLPDDHLVDRGYTSAPLLYDSQQDYGVNLFGPVVEKKTWQSKHGYGIEAFTIDWQNRQVTCPKGRVSNPWTMRDHRRDHQLTRVRFLTEDCTTCSVRKQCTKHHRRSLSFHEQPVFEIVQQRKQEQHTETWQQQYGKRAAIEGTISQGVFARGMRRSRYRGHDKTELQFVLTAAAMNLTRIMNWQNDVPRNKTRVTHFGRLTA